VPNQSFQCSTNEVSWIAKNPTAASGAGYARWIDAVRNADTR
jgi:hypothetical protein